MPRRGRLTEVVCVRVTSETAAGLRDLAAELQQRAGSRVTVYTADAVRTLVDQGLRARRRRRGHG